MGKQFVGALGCVVKVSNNIWVNAAGVYSPSVRTEFGDTADFAGRLGLWQF